MADKDPIQILNSYMIQCRTEIRDLQKRVTRLEGLASLKRNDTPLPELLTFLEAAEFFRLTETALRMLVFRKKVPFLKINGRVKFEKGAILEWLKNNATTRD